MESHDIIIKFINTFKGKYKDEIVYVFTNGQCYWFSFILKERFNGEIWYVPVHNHFITKINERFYDITGEVIDTERLKLARVWSEYQQFDPLDYDRLVRDCVNKVE